MSNATVFSSFIDATLTEMASKKSTSGSVIKRDKDGVAVKKNGSAAIAAMIQSMPQPHAANRIASLYIKLANDRTAAKRSKSAVSVNPEQLLSFIQQLMNQVCWSARRLVNAQNLHESELQAIGVDFSESIAETLGVEGVSNEHLAEVVETDHFILQNVQCWLASKMSYLTDIEPLFVYADRQPVVDFNGDTVWAIGEHADTFEQACAIMDGVINTLQDAEAEKAGAEAQHLDFTMTATSKAVPVPRLDHKVGETYKAPAKAAEPAPGFWARLFGTGALAAS